jgi:two-component system, chemotaxis family, chemotaxis protein CheY
MKPAKVVPETTTSSTRSSSTPSEPATKPSVAPPASTPARSFAALNPELTRTFASVRTDTSKPLTPAPTGASEAPRAFAKQTPGGAVQRVLLVDDSRSIRTLLKIYLMARAFEYLEAPSAEEGLQLLETEQVDLILTDFHMDGMNGADFAAQVRAHRSVRVSKIPILMMTGDANAAEVRNKGQKAGINAFVRKPVSCAQLMTLVDTILPPPKKG